MRAKKEFVGTIISRIDEILTKNRIDIHDVNGVRGQFINNIGLIEYWYPECEEAKEVERISRVFDVDCVTGAQTALVMALQSLKRIAC